MKKSDEQLLLTFERKVLRTIHGAVHEDERWRKRYDFELKRDFGEPDIVTVVKIQRFRWAAHLVRLEENRASLTLFRNNPGGRRGVGRPKMRYIDGVESDPRALGMRCWQSVARDSTQSGSKFSTRSRPISGCSAGKVSINESKEHYVFSRFLFIFEPSCWLLVYKRSRFRIVRLGDNIL